MNKVYLVTFEEVIQLRCAFSTWEKAEKWAKEQTGGNYPHDFFIHSVPMDHEN
jgi:hypothetical protein